MSGRKGQLGMRFLALILCLCSQYLLAEAAQPPQQPAPTYPALKTNPNNIQVFDADFFKETPKDTSTQAGATTPKGRAYADDPKYNTLNREQAMQKCEPLRNQNYSKYQECYKTEITNVQKGVQQKYDDVEERQKVPLKTAPNSLIEEQMRNPTGQEEE